jgi:hypothetical protein
MFGLIGLLSGEADGDGLEARFQRLLSPLQAEPVSISGPYRGRQGVVATVDPQPSSLRTAEAASFADGVMVVLIGEVFNDRQQEESQAALIHRLYSSYGVEVLSHLNGSYCLFIDDAGKRESLVAVDRFASRPVLYQVRGQELTIAPDHRCYTESGVASRTLSLSAVSAMLSNGHLVNDDTYLESVKFLPPGGAILVANGNSKLFRYWDYPLTATADDGEAVYRRQLSKLLVPAVERRLRWCSAPGLLLSGGIDSRALLGACMEVGRKVHVYSYYRREQAASDTDVARKLAKLAGMPFEAIRYDPADILATIRTSTPAFDGMRGPIYEVDALNQIRGRCDALLIGDESFGWHGHGLSDEETVLSRIGIHRLARSPIWEVLLTPEHYQRLRQADTDNFERLSARCLLSDLHDRKDYFYTTERLPRNIVLGRAYLNGFVARVRSPWLDNEIIEFFRRVPIKYRLSRSLYLATVQDMFPKLFDIPTATSAGNYSEDMIYRTMLRRNPELISTAFLEDRYPIDAMFRRNAFQQCFRISNQLSFARIKEYVKDSELVRLRQAGQWLSMTARRFSAPLAASLDREESFSQRRLFENLAILRFTAGERLRLDVD